MRFKEYTPSDYEACLELFELNCPSYFAEEEREDYKQYLGSNSDEYLLGYQDNSLVCCFGIGNISKDVASLTWIMVHPEHHRGGYGSAMMSHFFSRVKANSKQRVLIATSQHAEAFFRKYGAERLKFTEDGWGQGMHRIDMQISLDAAQ